jgi:hypothetical protein
MTTTDSDTEPATDPGDPSTTSLPATTDAAGSAGPRAVLVPETEVPAGEEPAAECPYCGRPFRDIAGKRLHVGEVHPDACTDAEWDDYEAARSDERNDLFYFHMRVVMALGGIYAVTVLVFMVALGSGFL